MEKRTLLAVVLSIVVISVFYFIQGIAMQSRASEQGSAVEEGRTPPPAAVATVLQTGDTPPPLPEASSESAALPEEPDAAPPAERRITVETPLVTVVLTNAGGDVVSYKLKEHKDQDDFVEMVLPGAGESHAFTIAFGGLNAEPVTSLFYVNTLSEYSVEFYRDFAISLNGEAGRFRLTKRYDFRPDEYMFELTVSLDGGYSVPSLNFSGAAYTLGFGPQIGPKFEKLDQRYDYRQYYTFTNGKRKQEKVTDNAPTLIDSRVSWAAIAGKYFAFIAIPDATQYQLAFSAKPEPGFASPSRFYMVRPPVNGSRAADTYRFYLGPKNQKALGIYDNGDNSFKLREMQFIKVLNTSGILSPVEAVLKWLLMFFYHIVPNYGVAIILLTLLVKILMFPLTKKGSESTLRMQTLAPKIKEIQDKYKDNPAKMNSEMAALYKKEGYNPLSGCLPLLLQFPLFIAMYNLFNNHFDLRGALFIPDWIPDLSLPETVWNFAPVQLPILGWSDLRLLPFIYVGSQLLYGKVTQTPDQKGNAQMKMMLYAMPIMFFFILYNVPSGLLLYWIMSNVLTMVQQLTINKYLARKKVPVVPEPEPVIAPRKKKKR
ncbi:MAG: membrane protein insertase YidC [Spirochaetaceae bacterium]|jgi:YidC/Oxa1 family membrane protein insertase|nr:membrane protein insertase YidC [Spirochaetaceae bacterium]